MPADGLGSQGQQQQVRLKRTAEGQPRLLVEALLAQAIGQAFDVTQDVDPAPRIPLALALVAQGGVQRRDLRPVVQLFEGLGQVAEQFGGPFHGQRAFEFVHAHRDNSYW